MLNVFCAQDETRTHTVLRPLPPQSSVYTNFTTCASSELACNNEMRFAHLGCRHSSSKIESNFRFGFYRECKSNRLRICKITLIFLCPKQDSNLHVSQHSHLKRARLPIPPFGRCVSNIVLTADSIPYSKTF